MRRSLFAIVIILCLGVVPALAQRGRGAGVGRAPGPPVMQGRPEMGGMHGRQDTPPGARATRSESRRDASGMDRGHQTPSDRIAENPRLASKVQPLLPNWMNARDAAGGFKNLGQFVATVHVSRNLGIPFEQLKARMTGPREISLGDAIRELKPGVDSKAEAKKAEKQAKTLLRESESKRS